MVGEVDKPAKKIDAVSGLRAELDQVKDSLEKQAKDLQKQEKAVEHVNYFLVVTVMVLLTTVTIMMLEFGDILIEHWKTKEASYRDLVDKINQQDSIFERIYDRPKK